MNISLSLHVIGIVMWLGGLMIGTRVLKYLQEESHRDVQGVIAGKIWFGFIIPGLTVVTFTGLYQFWSRGAAFYMKQGWFHGKLTLLLGLFVATYLMGEEIKKIRSGAEGSSKRIMMVHGLSSLILILIVSLTLIGR
jgi:uncharacterized membrane protein